MKKTYKEIFNIDDVQLNIDNVFLSCPKITYSCFYGYSRLCAIPWSLNDIIEKE